MKKIFFIFFALVVCSAQTAFAQIPTNTLVQIVKAEDERRYDATLENLLKNPDAKIRRRAALAAGRIGDERAILALVAHPNDDPAQAATILFALGEIESTKAAPKITEILKDPKQSGEVRARAIEAAGKIAAANPKDAQTPELGKTIVSALEYELGKNLARNREIVLLGITAVLRARPEGGEITTAKFLDDADARIRADALNTLARLRSKNANEKARELLARDLDPIVRANAARMLGVGEDKSAIDLLLNVATKDIDSRVRVSAIRSLGNLKDAGSAERLLSAKEEWLNDLALCKNVSKKIKGIAGCNATKSELLEISTTLGRILDGTNNQKAVKFLVSFRESDAYGSPENEIAFAKIAPEKYVKRFSPPPTANDLQMLKTEHRIASSLAQGLGELAKNSDNKIKAEAEKILNSLLGKYEVNTYAVSDVLTAYSAFKPNDLNQVLLKHLKHNDSIVRAAAAGILADQSVTKESVEALQTAFNQAFLTDKRENDAQLAILNALYKLDKKASVETFLIALNAADYLVRKRAFEILKDVDLQKDYPGIPSSLANFAAKKANQVLPYAAYTGTKLGQILNTNADYIRAVSRKNGTVKAVLTTTKGVFAIDFTPEDAPLAVDNFIKLARVRYFNGLSVHRVVPNFVMQDGDPRGDGSGGPGWEIRCEINMLPFERGAIGMALSGKDTGGSQWFAAHSPQPHLDGGYAVFGKINETDMKIVDSIVRGDKILSVRIVEKTTRGKR